MTIPVMIGKIIGKIKGIKIKSLLFLIKKFSFSVTILPGETSIFRATTFSYGKILTAIGVYTFLCILFTGFLMVYSPMNKYFFSEEVRLSHFQISQLRKLENEVGVLLQEIESIKKSNEMLKTAILRGDSTLINDVINKR